MILLFLFHFKTAQTAFFFFNRIACFFSLLQVAGVVLLEESKHSQREEDFGYDPRRPPSPLLPPLPPRPSPLPPVSLPFIVLSGTAKSVTEASRGGERGNDDVPSAAAPLLLPPHAACDGHSALLRSPRVTAPLCALSCVYCGPRHLVGVPPSRRSLFLSRHSGPSSVFATSLTLRVVHKSVKRHFQVHSVRTHRLGQLGISAWTSGSNLRLFGQNKQNKLKGQTKKGQAASKR